MTHKMCWAGICLLVAVVFLLIVFCGNRAVSTIAEITSAEDIHCVVIDPGHGGEDGGAISCTGEPESRYNLEIAKKLNDLLNLLGIRTKMIRTEDISVYTKGETLSQKKISDLKERVRIINDTPDAILLSIHQNYFSDSRYSGAQVFYSSFDGSRKLAETMQVLFTSTLNRSSKRCVKKSTGIYLMEHIRCPGVLIECGFLSNPEENEKLRNPQYQKQLCCVIAASVSEYISNT